MNIRTGRIAKAQKVVVYGPEGIGKTTFAASFPDPLFIDTEGGTNAFDVKRADPAPTSWSMLLGYVAEVRADPSVCRTLVIDTADWAERMCAEHVMAAHDVKGIEDFGYGKGYTFVNEEFGRLLDRLTDLVEAGINVVVTAHSRVQKFEQPDELGTYDRWTLKLIDTPKASNASMLKEWCDMLIFANYETVIVQPDKKSGGHSKAAGGKKRVMYASHNAAWDAKNRCGLPDKMPFEFAAIASAIPAAVKPTATASAPIAGMPAEPEPAPAKAPAATAKPATVTAGPGQTVTYGKDGKATVTDTQPAENPSAPPAEPGHLKPLRDLMAGSGVTDEQLMGHSGRMGYCTASTPVSVYPADFAGFLVTDWGNVVKEINEWTAPVPFEKEG